MSLGFNRIAEEPKCRLILEDGHVRDLPTLADVNSSILTDKAAPKTFYDQLHKLANSGISLDHVIAPGKHGGLVIRGTRAEAERILDVAFDVHALGARVSTNPLCGRITGSFGQAVAKKIAEPSIARAFSHSATPANDCFVPRFPSFCAA